MPKTAYEKASEALAAAEKKVARLTAKKDKATAEAASAQQALAVAEWEVNNLKSHPALQNPPAEDGGVPTDTAYVEGQVGTEGNVPEPVVQTPEVPATAPTPEVPAQPQPVAAAVDDPFAS